MPIQSSVTADLQNPVCCIIWGKTWKKKVTLPEVPWTSFKYSHKAGEFRFASENVSTHLKSQPVPASYFYKSLMAALGDRLGVYVWNVRIQFWPRPSSVPTIAAKIPPEGDLCLVRWRGFRVGLGVLGTFLPLKQQNCKSCISLSLLFAEF